MIDKEQIISEIMAIDENTTTNRNSMGCSENWYNPYYAMSQTFSIEDLKNMNETMLNNLVNLANNIAEGLY